MTEPGPGAYHQARHAPAERPAGCPVDAGFNPLAADFLADPYPALQRLNAEQPVFYSEQLRCLVVTRMADIAAIFKDPDAFSSANVQDPVFPLCAQAKQILASPDFRPIAVMSNRQPPDHARIRRYTAAAFSGRRLSLLAPYIRTRCHELIDAMQANGTAAEFVSAFAHPLPGQTIFRLLGFPEADDARLMRWTANRLAFTWGQPDESEQVAIAENLLKYWRYCCDFVAARAAQPADDLASELLAVHRNDAGELSYREVESIVYGLSFAGHEIVSHFLANALLCVLPRPAVVAALRAAPDRIENCLEEVLRFASPQIGWRRITTRAMAFAGVQIPAGTQVFLSLGAANHDPRAFAEPTQFDPGRADARRHISFGLGIHYCLGARLARLEARIALAALLERLPGLRLVPGEPRVYPPNVTFRGPAQLHIAWDGAPPQP